MRTVLGIIIILAGLVGLVFGIYGTFWIQGTARDAEQNIVAGMDFGLEGLEVISDTLQAAMVTVTDTTTILDAAVVSSQQIAETLESISPAVTQMETIITSDLPANIQTIQDAMPGLQQAAAAIDSTLRTLANFQWSATIPIINYTLSFGLGIVYDPPVPLDQSVAEIDSALGTLPDELTGMETSFEDTNRNLEQTAATVDEVGASLAQVSADLAATREILTEYSGLVARAITQVRAMRRDIRQQINTTRITLSMIMIWLALSQAAPLYLGCSIVFSKAGPEPRR